MSEATPPWGASANATRDRMLGLAVLVALALAALVPGLPLLVLVIAVGTFAAARDASLRWASAAAIPVALILGWGAIADDALADLRFVCADPASPLAVARALEAALIIGAVLFLAQRLGQSPADLGLRRPARTELVLAVVAIIIVPVFSLAAGPILAEPFFGPMGLELAPAALLPAVIMATANGTLEELAYRGALLRWGGRLTGFGVALMGQAVVFGLAHLGDDLTGSPVPVVLTVACGGLVAGLWVRRSGSLFLPIVVHVCFDIPLYFALACRT